MIGMQQNLEISILNGHLFYQDALENSSEIASE